MLEYVEIDQLTWKRQQHFQFYMNFKQPYFQVIENRDFSSLYESCKLNKYPFYTACCHVLLNAMHQIPEFMTRVLPNSRVVQYKSVKLAAVQLAHDETIRFSYIDFKKDKQLFLDLFIKAKLCALKQPFFSKEFKALEGQGNWIHLSVLPLSHFSGFSHATNFGDGLGIPKIMFGKYNQQTGLMPIAVDVHHGLVDGLHVAQLLQATLSNGESFFDPEMSCDGVS